MNPPHSIRGNVEGGVWGALNAKEEVVLGAANVTNSTTTTSDSTEEVPMDTQQTQATLDSTVSLMQSSLQQEVERANWLRKVAAEENVKSVVDM